MSKLFTPLPLACGLELPNRLSLAPLTNLQSNDDGTLGEDEFHWLLARAEGGFGWISTCAAYVSSEGKAWKGQLGIAESAHLPGLRRIADMLRERGVRSCVQLHHAGAKAEMCPGPKLAPSASEDGSSRAASSDDIERVIDDYVQAARRAKEAGFDAVEIHGANGYLFTQFLSPVLNRRTDDWGGGLEGRARLLIDTLRAVRAEVSSSIAVAVRISPVDSWAEHGLVLADARKLAAMLGDSGLDILHLSLPHALTTPPREDSDECVTTAMRQALDDSIALMTVGQVWTRGDAEAALEAGADLVALGRSAIGNPNWPLDAQSADHAPARPPFGEELLESASIGPAFRDYLMRFPGLVVGGASPRS